ncbi:helix-turn-helix domain-containing protein [Lentzea sp.]|uniref:helix-turn-helix domain-containing protein n=1 Tax=Lentzea sp. TaxID=56099 RepID=UPI002ED28E21
MAGTRRPGGLSDLLEDLKARSGLSYEGIGRKTHLSKSAVHRYCTGLSVPQDFGVLERIGLACGATTAERLRLHDLWAGAVTAREKAVVVPAAVPVEVVPVKAVPSPVVPRPVVVPPAVKRRSWRRPVSVSIVCLVVWLVSGAQSHVVIPLATPQRVDGPAWTLPAAPVPSTLFGVTINSATGGMPAFRVGAVRLWDSGTRWSEVQAARGEFDWSTSDRLVDGAERAGVPVLFVFGGTPRWAAPSGRPSVYPDGSSSAPPDDLADWDAYVRAVAQRYRGRISAYELWVLGNDSRFYSGSTETLVEMTRRASTIIRATDAEATVVCPGMGQLWSEDGLRAFRRFAGLGGYGHCEVAGVKLFQRDASEPPETMLTLTAMIDQVLHEAGVHPRLWNTGTTYTIPLQGPLDERTAVNHAVRFFLVGVYARNRNLERMYFYNWGGTKIPIVLQAVGGTPTAAALAVEQLQRWLAHARSRSCGHGAASGLPGNVWQCRFTITTTGQPHEACIRWTDTGSATTTAEPGTLSVRRLDGTSTATQPGDTIAVAEEPVLIEYG